MPWSLKGVGKRNIDGKGDGFSAFRLPSSGGNQGAGEALLWMKRETGLFQTLK